MRVTREGLALTLHAPAGRERLALTGGYPDGLFARFLFAQVGLMHLAAAHLPPVLDPDFWVAPEIARLIGKMYRSEGRRPPKIRSGNDFFKMEYVLPRTDSKKVAVSYSGGKDSIWNLWHASRDRGMENVLLVHVHGLNTANASRELAYTRRQAQAYGVPHLRVLDLVNSSGLKGYMVMRSRDIFMAALAIPSALEFGASKVYIEGFAETSPDEPFSGQERNMRFFNLTLQALGIPVQVAWKNRTEMGVMEDLLRHKPEWLPHVVNCFSAPLYQPGIRRSWARNAPSFPLYDSQCGSCVKCRITNLGRVLHDKELRRTTRPEDVRYFLANTAAWMRGKGVTHADMIGGSFTRDFKHARREFSV
ncbi:MAG: hypothetical protein A3G64_00130 [Candidatus Liptonbacteria bacterium RIFCSPLOWO2_12_FULL_60_15]|uniref:Uncharacterized protein n=1 Tax=Candidatus Liptonbacteria bacterium RIFCSPLOWO2_12_FULL_60_15 TaxID=1798653 RepID=A0A1G2CJT3_9BACT|nr:MAG: hypothetical protein A3G64_00130 [Candidatus Liptonbacteria bacterium RIFCSPLOWO2_12_FULL_60_15]